MLRVFKVSNAELDASDRELDGIFTFKKIKVFADNEIEIFATEVSKVENSEATFVDIQIECLFSREGLGEDILYHIMQILMQQIIS